MDVTGYEISSVNSFILFILSGIILINSQRKSYQKPLTTVWKKLPELLIVFTIPLAISLFSNAFISDCPVTAYALFYFTGTLPALILGALCGLTACELYLKRAYLIFFVIFVLLLFTGLSEVYFNPQIFLYEPFTGYYPGNIYDEDIHITFKIISYRLINIFFWIILFYLIQKFDLKISKLRKVSFVIFCFIIITAFSFVKPFLGYSSTISSIYKELKGKTETEHFVIYYPEEEPKKKINYLKLQSEYYFERICGQLKIDFTEKITIFLFKNREQKKELFGAANADVAKTWLKQIYVDAGSFTESLQHEIVHIVATEWGTFPFYIAGNMNFGLTEGLAVAIDNDFDDKNPDYLASVGIQSGYKPDLKTIFNNLSFFSNSSVLSYIYAGSFTKFIFVKYGAEKVKTLYKTGDFEKTFNVPFTKLQKDYEKYISDKSFTADKKEAEVYFTGKSLFKKFCPRLVSKRMSEAAQYAYLKDYKSAKKTYKMIYQKTGSFPSFRGFIYNCIFTGDYDEALDSISQSQDKFQNSVYYDVLEIFKGDLFALKGNQLKADSIYKNSVIQVYYSLKDNLQKKIIIQESSNKLLQKYILGTSQERLSIFEKINSDTVRYFTISEIISLNRNLKNDYLHFIKEFDTVNFDDKNWCQPVYELSIYAKEEGDYNRSLKFAEAALKLSDKVNEQRYLENIEKIKWLIEKKKGNSIK